MELLGSVEIKALARPTAGRYPLEAVRGFFCAAQVPVQFSGAFSRREASAYFLTIIDSSLKL